VAGGVVLLVVALQMIGGAEALRWHEPTIACVERRTAEGLSKREIIRCLKRYLAREVYGLLPTEGISEHVRAA
jgi:transposase